VMSKIQKPYRKTAKQKDPNRYSKGWNRKRTQALIDYYENQTDDQAIAEAEAAYENNTIAMSPFPSNWSPRSKGSSPNGLDNFEAKSEPAVVVPSTVSAPKSTIRLSACYFRSTRVLTSPPKESATIELLIDPLPQRISS
jgi:hypothetical protein